MGRGRGFNTLGSREPVYTPASAMVALCEKCWRRGLGMKPVCKGQSFVRYQRKLVCKDQLFVKCWRRGLGSKPVCKG
jgi:hypothetical protein